MAQVVCKDAREIWYVYFGGVGSTVFTTSKYNFNDIKGTLIDLRMLNVKRYDGFKDNEHHITTESYYKIIIPFLNLYIKTFKFNYDDFELVPYFTKDNKFNCSYLKPKNEEHRFTISIDGKTVARHAKFDALHNAKRFHKDKDTYFEKNGFDVSEYHRIFRGAHSCCRIVNETIGNDKKIFISGDSMMIPIIPILCCYFKEVVYMDNRDGKSHKDYFEGKIFDTIILQFFDGGTWKKVLGDNLM